MPGATSLHLGELVAAHTSPERAIALYDPQQHRAQAWLYGEETGVIARAYIGGRCGCWATRTRLYSGASRPCAWLRRSRPLSARHLPWPGPPRSVSSARRHRPRKSTPRCLSRSRRSNGFRSGKPMAGSYGAGPSPRKARGKRVLPRCDGAMMPGRQRGPRWTRTFWCCWRRRMARGQVTRDGDPPWRRLWGQRGALLEASGIGSRASYCWRTLAAAERRRKPLCVRPSTWPAAAGQVTGAAGCHQPGAPVATPGQARRSPRAAGTDLRLVHRGLRHRRPPGGQGVLEELG